MRGFSGLTRVVAFLLVAGTIAVPAADAGTARAGATAQASTLYVDQIPTCSDSGPGSAQTPFCTIQAAANVVNPGQTVDIVGGRDYQGPVSITRSGTPSEPITFTWSASTLASSTLESSGSLSPVLDLDKVHDIRISSLGVVAQDGADGIWLIASSDISLDQVIVEQQNTPANATATGIWVDGSSDVSVSRSSILGFGSYGLLADNGSTGLAVTASAIASAAGPGISVEGPAVAQLVSDSVATSCASAVMLWDVASTTVENDVLGTVRSTSCTLNGTAALYVDSLSAGAVTTDYDVLSAKGAATEYSWADTPYTTAAAFNAATGQGAHDFDYEYVTDTTVLSGQAPPLAVDSANCGAPDEPTTDWAGHAHVRDPLVSIGNGAGTCYADRGAYELQDQLAFNYSVTPSSPQSFAPETVGVELTAANASGWGEPVSYSVNWGDGSAAVPVALGQTAMHHYGTPGQYLLTVTATDSGGSTQTQRYQLTVWTAAVPKVSLTAVPVVRQSSFGPFDVADSADFSVGATADGWEFRSGTIDFGDGSQLFLGDESSTSHVYAKPGTYRVTLTETDQLGRTTEATDEVTVGDEFRTDGPVTDYSRAVPAHGVVKLSMSALRATDPQVRGAYLEVTAGNPKETGYLTVYPDGASRPTDPTLQFRAGRSSSNLILAIPRADGTVDFYNGSGGSVSLTVHTVGFDTNQLAFQDVYTPDGPARVLPAAKVTGGGRVTVTVAGTHGVPANADSVVLDVTAIGTQAAGYVTAYPDKGSDSGLHVADWAKGQAITGLVVVPLLDGKVVLHNASRAAASLIADVVGYYNYLSTGSVFLPASSPYRLLDVKIAAKHSTTLRISGKDGLPGSGISAAAVNLTAGGATAGGYIVGWADMAARPNATSLTYSAGASAAAAGIIPVGADGVIDLYNGGLSTVNLIIDLTGAYYQYP